MIKLKYTVLSIGRSILLGFILLLLTFCNRKENPNSTTPYSKIGYFYKDSFDLRVSDFLSMYDDSEYFTFIDYSTCARCSDSKIIDYFENLNQNKSLTLFFNDSIVYHSYLKGFPSINWVYLENAYWDEYHLRSSNIIEYQKGNNNYTRVNYGD